MSLDSVSKTVKELEAKYPFGVPVAELQKKLAIETSLDGELVLQIIMQAEQARVIRLNLHGRYCTD